MLVGGCCVVVSGTADVGAAGVQQRLPVDERRERFLGSRVGVVRGSGGAVGVAREVAGRVSGGHLRKRDH